MKHSLIALGAVAALAACTPAPQSASEMRSAAGSAMFGQTSVQKVNRSYGAVVASLRAGAGKCLNRNQRVDMPYRPGPNMPVMTQSMVSYYSTTVKSSGSKTELMMRKKMQGAMLIGGGKDNSGVAYLVDVAPASGGTQLKFYGGKVGYGDLNKAVMQWANGGAIRCPELP